MMYIRTISIIALCVGLLGCATYGREIDNSYVQTIKKGETTEREIRMHLGSPISVGVSEDGNRSLTYMYSHSQADAISYLPIIGELAGSVDTTSQMLQIWVDTNGVVKNYSFTTSSTDENNESLLSTPTETVRK